MTGEHPSRLVLAVALAAALAAAVVAAALAAAPSFAYAAASGPALVVQSVDTSSYPRVVMHVLLPTDAGSGTPRFSVRENGGEREVTVGGVSAAVSRPPLAVVLVVDTSGSMRGKPIAEARQAALAFVRALRPDDQVALVSFSDRPHVALRFTADRAAISSALDKLGASGETALYDSIIAGAALGTSAKAGGRSLVVLSDGGDTASTATRDTMLRAVKASGVPVYTLGLSSPEADPAVLAQVASQSRGKTFTVRDAAALTAVYGTVAREIQNGWDVSFVSARPNTKDLDLDVLAKVGETTYRSALVVPNPTYDVMTMAGGTGLAVTPLTLGIIGILGVGSVVFVAVSLMIFGLVSLLAREPTTLRHVRYYGGDPARGAAAATPDSVTARMMEAVGAAATRRGITGEVEARLARAGLPLRALEYMFLHIVTVCLVGAVTQLVVGSFVLSVGLVIVATILPFVLLDMLASRRREQFQAQLPQVLSLLAGSLRAGYGLLQGVELIVKEMPPPTSTELGRVVTEARLGLPVEAALEKVGDRMGSDDFKWAVSAIGIQREVGGNLAEVLDIVGRTIRERDALRRQISGLTAEGRLSALILSILPFVVLGAMIVVAPTYIGGLFLNPMGLFISAVAVLLLIAGLIWLRRIVRIEV